MPSPGVPCLAFCLFCLLSVLLGVTLASPSPASLGSPSGLFQAVGAPGGFAVNPGRVSGQTEGPEPHSRPLHPDGIPGLAEEASAGRPDLLMLCVVHGFRPVFECVSASLLLQVTLSSLSEQQALSLQQRALFLTDNQLSFVDNLTDVYQLKSADMALLQQHVVRLQSLNLYKEVSVDRKVFNLAQSCIQNKKKKLFLSFFFLKAAMLSMKLQCQKELDLEEVRLRCFS